jgi:DNA adenine methylase
LAESVWKLIKPLLRWAGGKRKLAPTICDLFPAEFWSGSGRYFEPFGGGAAVAIEAAKQRSSKDFYLSDSNEDLINLYKTVQIEPGKLIAYISIQKFSNTSDCYYKVRCTAETEPIARAARTLYLNATCFNGLYRTNASGGFNVPFGQLANPDFIKTELIFELSTLLKDAVFSTQNFDEFLDLRKPIKGDVVYLDPPYVPLSSTASFTAYAKAGFGLDDQKHLAKVIHRLVESDVSVILSNSYTDLTMGIFAGTGLRFFKVSMMRSIAAKAQSRNSVYEILASNVLLSDIPKGLEAISL